MLCFVCLELLAPYLHGILETFYFIFYLDFLSDRYWLIIRKKNQIKSKFYPFLETPNI